MVGRWDDTATLWDDPVWEWDHHPPLPPVTHLIWTHDYAGAQTMVLHQLLALETDDRLQDAELLRFTIPADDPKAGFLLLDADVRYRDRFYRVQKLDPQRDGSRAVIEVEAEARWTELLGPTRVGNFTLVDVAPDAGLASILDVTDWTVGSAPSSGTYAIDRADFTVLALIREWARITGTEVVFNTGDRTVDLVAQQGAERHLGFRYGYNLRGIIRRQTPPEATRLYPYGRNDLNIAALTVGGVQYLEDFAFYTDLGLTEEEARARYTRSQVWSDDSFIDDVSLYNAAVLRLAELSQPEVSYESTVADLAAATDSPIGRFTLGDTVPVFDGPLGISIRTRIVRIVRRPLNPSQTEIELGTLQLAASSGAAGRGTDTKEWLLFVAEANPARTLDFRLAILNDIGLQFASGGEAVFHADIIGVATGAGTLTVSLYDEIGNVAIGPVFDKVFADGEVLHVVSTFGLADLQGNYLFSLRVDVTAGSGTIAVAAGDSRFSILTRGGLGVSVAPEANSAVFEYTGDTQEWEVPVGVSSAVIDCYGASGGDHGAKAGGNGGRVRARVDVISGETLNVEVGGQGDSAGTTWAYNGGGRGGDGFGGGGGGGSDVRRGSTYADRLVVAGGGGGAGSFSPFIAAGGDGGYPEGEDGDPGDVGWGSGGTQSAGGDDGVGGHAGTLGVGGDAAQSALNGGGGGGGGLYGGGGARSGGGGGGSGGTPDPSASELLVENGARTGHGRIVISWDNPV